MIDQSHLKDLAVSDTGFIFDPYSGATFTVNETGLDILSALREGRRIDQIVEDLRTAFAGTPPEATEDVHDFLRALQQHGLLPSDFEAR
jgi:PqqD family protein of HPr-rel-A system